MLLKRTTSYALLGLLSWKPMSGYDIKKFVDIGLSHFWNENYGQIYPTLELLVNEGLAKKSADQSSGKRKRNVYRITPRGEKAFRTWLMLPSSPPRVRNELQLRFFLSGRLTITTTRKLITDYRQQQKVVLEQYRASEKALRAAVKSGQFPDEIERLLCDDEKPLNPKQRTRQCGIFLLTLRHGVLAIEGRLKWCDEALEFLQKGEQ